ncbi:MAG: ABC transporter permease [Myxococcota bacterium]
MTFLARVAWRNLWRHARRSLITAFAMAVGVAMCMGFLAFDDGIYDEMFDVMVERSLGHVQVHDPNYPSTRAMFSSIADGDAVLSRIEAMPETRAATGRLFGFALVGGETVSSGALLTGIDPAREAVVSPLPTKVVDGRYLAEAADHEILLGKGLAEEIAAKVGDSVVVVTQAADGSTGNDAYTVVGLVKTGSVQVDDAGAFLHLADLRSLLVMDAKLHEITALTHDDREIASFADRVRAAVGDALLVRTWYEAAPAVAQILGMRNVSSGVLLGIVFSVAALGVLNTMMMSVFERTQELGVLRALGLRPGRLVVLILVESVFLASLACAIGLTLGGLLDLYLVVHGVDFSAAISSFDFGGFSLDPVVHGAVHPDGIVVVTVAVFVVSILASVWPAVRAARLRPVEAIRQE